MPPQWGWGYGVWALVWAAGVVGALVLATNCVSVPAGYAGIKDRFGVVDSKVLQAGLHVKNPLDAVWLASLQTQLQDSHQDVPTAEGLVVGLDVSVLFHLNSDPQALRSLYINTGKQYSDLLITPELRSAIRNRTSELSAKALYSTGRTGLADALQEELNQKLGPRGIVIEQVLLRSIKLPDELRTAIETKLKSEQESQRMEFVLSKEKQEAERKRIEAQGIADFQAIVTKGISRQLLEWKGIEATEKLADSKNAKVVIIGNPTNGLPLVFNEQEAGKRSSGR
ncbi:hypothetical protein WJX72_010399 [[Myrmecia] bisecta]|uniref:Prohibitin n=1 Tax=[Myrmecia] bisecta TaxID=41462 RepID=A0AAW1P5Q2_9CHLO